jgi:hypothetical protein
MTQTERARKRDLALVRRITSRARYSLAILGMSFVRHGSGRFLRLDDPLKRRRFKKGD